MNSNLVYRCLMGYHSSGNSNNSQTPLGHQATKNCVFVTFAAHISPFWTQIVDSPIILVAK